MFLFLFFVQARIANDSFELFLYLSDLLDLSLEWVSLGLVVTGWFGCTREVLYNTEVTGHSLEKISESIN